MSALPYEHLFTYAQTSGVIKRVRLFLAKVQLRTEVLRTPSLPRLGFELMTSRT